MLEATPWQMVPKTVGTFERKGEVQTRTMESKLQPLGPGVRGGRVVLCMDGLNEVNSSFALCFKRATCWVSTSIICDLTDPPGVLSDSRIWARDRRRAVLRYDVLYRVP